MVQEIALVRGTCELNIALSGRGPALLMPKCKYLRNY